MGKTRHFNDWLDMLAAGEPLAVALAIPLGLALIAILVLTIRIGRNRKDTRDPKPKRLKWTENDPPESQRPA